VPSAAPRLPVRWPGWTHAAHHCDTEVAGSEAAVLAVRAVALGIDGVLPEP
jgi:hypothetical protein